MALRLTVESVEAGRLGLENVVWLSEPVALTSIGTAVRDRHEVRIVDLRLETEDTLARELDADLFVCSPYKFFGPHTGALYGKREHLARLRPCKVRPAADQLPDRWETGTQNHEGIAGVLGALEYLEWVG